MSLSGNHHYCSSVSEHYLDNSIVNNLHTSNINSSVNKNTTQLVKDQPECGSFSLCLENKQNNQCKNIETNNLLFKSYNNSNSPCLNKDCLSSKCFCKVHSLCNNKDYSCSCVFNYSTPSFSLPLKTPTTTHSVQNNKVFAATDNPNLVVDFSDDVESNPSLEEMNSFANAVKMKHKLVCECGENTKYCKKSNINTKYMEIDDVFINSVIKNNIVSSLSKNTNFETQVKGKENHSIYLNNPITYVTCYIPNSNKTVRSKALCDSGSPINIINRKLLPSNVKLHKSDIKFYSCNNKSLPIEHYTFLRVKIDSSHKHKLLKVYLCSDLAHNVILGVDGMAKFGVCLSFSHPENHTSICCCHNKGNCSSSVNEQIKIEDQQSDVFIKVINEEVTINSDKYNSDTLPDSFDKEVASLLNKHKSIWPSTLPAESACVSDFSIKIIDNSQPFQLKSYRLTHKEKLALDSEICLLLELGIISRLPTPEYLSPVVLVKKSDGTLRVCVDFRALNKQTVQSKLLLPNVEDVIAKLANKEVFTSIDLRSGFWQVPVEKASRKFLGFSTQKGNFSWNRMPFGLRNATNHFQSCMMKVLDKCSDFCLVYVDDIIIFSQTHTEHLEHLAKVFKCLQEAKLCIKIEKCKFCVDEISFLGFKFNSKGYSPGNNKLNKIFDFKTPSDANHLHSFLGLSNFFRKFVPEYASITAPLYKLLKKKVIFEWSEEQEKSFSILKEKFPALSGRTE